MKLLLDEMFPARLAQKLRDRGLDAVGVDERPPLRGLADDELLVIAARERRALISENVADFMRLSGEWADAARAHAGIVITLSSRFTRTPGGYEATAEALAQLCAMRPGEDDLADEVHFLTPT